jgi:hypothetical protein
MSKKQSVWTKITIYFVFLLPKFIYNLLKI